MGIVFGKSRENNVKVLSMRETQSLPVVKMNRKFGKSNKEGQQGRSTSYQTALPGLPNFISSDEDTTKSPLPIPPPFTLPPVSQRAVITSNKGRKGHSPKVVAELSSSNSDYSSCVEDFTSQVQREKTVLIKEILGKRLEELRELQKNNMQSSRESCRKFISSRDSYRKIYLKSRKRSNRNSCLSESSLSNSFIRDEDTISGGSAGDTLSDDVRVGTLIRDECKPHKRNTTGCRISRKSTLNSAIRFNSSSDEELPQHSIRNHATTQGKRVQGKRVTTRADTVTSGRMRSGMRKSRSARKSGGWLLNGGTSFRKSSSKKSVIPAEYYDADASCEESDYSLSDESEDELNYSKRFKTNPFLRSTSTNFIRRYEATEQDRSIAAHPIPGPSNIPPIKQQTTRAPIEDQTIRASGEKPKPINEKIVSQQPGQHPIKPGNLGHLLPHYAKSSYDKTTLPTIVQTRTRGQSSTDQFRVVRDPVVEVGKMSGGLRWSKRDEYTELDSAVDMFQHLL